MLKKDLRKEFLIKRKSLTDRELSTYSEQICAKLFQSFPIQSFSNIHIFLPIKKQNEIDTWLIINTFRKDFSQINIILPRISENGEMENYLFTDETKFEESKWGIEEPTINYQRAANRFSTANSQIDLVILPLLIFDKKGYRVGYGKGFYDKFLASCRADVLKIGLSIFEPIEAIEDINEFDIKMNFCVTPKQIWTF